MQAQAILDRARLILQDLGATRWGTPELLGWLSDGLRELATVKPTAVAAVRAAALVAGTRQTVPPGTFQLLRVVRNLASTAPGAAAGRAVRLVERAMLDAMHPYWHDGSRFTFTREVRQFAFDDMEPTTFYVFPGNDGTGCVELVTAALPAELVDAGNVLPVGAEYANALLDYVLYRCFDKDADYPGNAERSAKHYQAFMAALGVKSGGEAATSPNAGPAR